MSSAGIPLRVIQEILGHNDSGTLQRYLEVLPEQKRNPMAAIRFRLVLLCVLQKVTEAFSLA